MPTRQDILFIELSVRVTFACILQKYIENFLYVSIRPFKIQLCLLEDILFIELSVRVTFACILQKYIENFLFLDTKFKEAEFLLDLTPPETEFLVQLWPTLNGFEKRRKSYSK